MKYASINPATNILAKQFAFASHKQISQKIASSFQAYKAHRKTSFAQRGQKARKIASFLESKAQSYGKIASMQMGKPYPQAVAQFKKAAGLARYYADIAQNTLKPKVIQMQFKKAMSVYQPLGPIFSIQPWNFPLFLPFKASIASIMAGNTMLLKPAPSVPQMSLIVKQAYIEGGFDNGEFDTVFAKNQDCESIIGHPNIRGVTFTGSCEAGKKVAAIAGKYMKKCAFQLGGSDPFIVIQDADLDLAAQKAAAGRLANSGQACINVKRMIVMQSVYNQYREKLVKVLEKTYKVGDPMKDGVNIGPLARKDLLDNLKNQVRLTVENGARITYGDSSQIQASNDQGGNYFSPILIQGVEKSNPGYQLEFFGPVFVLYKVKSEEQAINLANDVAYGLGGSVFSRDEERAVDIAKQIETGMVFINDFTSSHQALPFGGTKDSGYGRECGEAGLLQFTNVKTLAIP